MTTCQFYSREYNWDNCLSPKMFDILWFHLPTKFMSAKGTFMFCSLGIKVLNNNATYSYDKIFWNLRSKILHWNKVYWNQNIIKTLSLQTCGICNVGSLFVFVIIPVVFQIFHLASNKLLRQLWLFRKSRMLLASSSPCDSCRKWPAPSTTC